MCESEIVRYGVEAVKSVWVGRATLVRKVVSVVSEGASSELKRKERRAKEVSYPIPRSNTISS